MQRVPGVTCDCCGEELGSNSQCGKKSSSTSFRKRPPCLWAHTDASIVERCVRKGLGAKAVHQKNEVESSKEMLAVGTRVFVRPMIGGYGNLGVIAGHVPGDVQTLYQVRFEGRGVSGDIPPHMVFEYIDRTMMHRYPSGALPFDASVRCFVDGEQHVCGIIQGVAVDRRNHAIYYDVGPNCTPKQFFVAADVSLVLQEVVQVSQAAVIESPPAAVPAAPVVVVDSSDEFEPDKTKTAAAAPPTKTPASKPQAVRTEPANKKLASGGTNAAAASKEKRAVPAAPLVAVDINPRASPAPSAAPPASLAPSAAPPASPAASAAPRASPAPSAAPAAQAASSAAAPRTFAARKPQDLGEAPGSATPAVPKTKTRPRSSSSSGSSSSDSEGKGAKKQSAKARKRAAKFNLLHDDDETLVIFHQVQVNIPWLHSRTSQKTIWDHHLRELWKEGHATELQGHKDAVKTFSAWAQNICKTRRTSRLAEARKSGFASVEPDVVDDVAYRWEMKVCGDAEDTEMNQQRAILFRDIATTTAVDLHTTAAKIENVRRQRYSTGNRNGGGAAKTPTKAGTPSSSSNTGSPQENAKTSLLRTLNDITRHTAEQEEKDAALVSQVVSGIAAQFAQGGSSQPSDTSGELLLLRNFLQREDSSLVNWAPQIHAALGITEGAHFKELTEEDIAQATGIPLLQRKRLIAIAKRFFIY